MLDGDGLIGGGKCTMVKDSGVKGDRGRVFTQQRGSTISTAGECLANGWRMEAGGDERCLQNLWIAFRTFGVAPGITCGSRTGTNHITIANLCISSSCMVPTFATLSSVGTDDEHILGFLTMVIEPPIIQSGPSFAKLGCRFRKLGLGTFTCTKVPHQRQ